MKIGAATLNQTPLDWDNNKKNILAAINSARDSNVNLLCLPELCITGYGCEDMFLHPWVADSALDMLNDLVAITHDIAVIVGLPYHHKGKIYNTSCLIKDGEIIGFQAKQHLPKDGIHYEPRWFEPWPSSIVEKVKIGTIEVPFGDRTYEIDGLRIGFEICEDAWVEDRPACRLVKEKVDIILNPSASHFALGKSVIRENKVIDASKEFNCTYVFANQLGNEAGRIIYDGDALIAHKGVLCANTSLFSYWNFEICIWDNADGTGSALKTHITDYKEQFIAATSLGLFDYLRKSRSNGFVLSLSGGADSSLCLILMVESIKRGIQQLGKDGYLLKLGLEIDPSLSQEQVINRLITAAYQGTNKSTKTTLNSAQQLAKSVGAKFHHWMIDELEAKAIDTIQEAIGRTLNWERDDIALQNIQARSRSPLIWMIANLTNSLLITTSNRSEGAVGYTTMDGDTSGSLAPIAGVSKIFIIEWLKWAEKALHYPALKYVNQLKPSAELRPAAYAQTDEDDLMPYEILTEIEDSFLIRRLPPLEIHKILCASIDERKAATYIIKFFQLWSRNQWKRERIAPSFHIDDHNLDPRSWLRFPILSGAFKSELEQLQAKLNK